MKQFYLLAFCLVLILHPAQSQQKLSIKKMADSCMMLRNTGNLENGLKLCGQMLDLLPKLPDSYDKGNAYRIAGNLHMEKYDYENGESHYAKAIAISEKLGKKEGLTLKATTIFNHTIMYCNNSDYETALKMCLQAENIFQQLNDMSNLALVDDRIEAIYQLLDQTDKALYYARKASREAQQSGDQEVICVTHLDNADNLLSAGDTIGALKQYQEVIETGKSKKFYYLMSPTYHSIAFVFSHKRDYKKALQYFHEAYKWALKNRLLLDQCGALHEIGLMHFYSGNYNTARDTLLISLTLAEKLNSKQLQSDIYNSLNLLELKSGNVAKAYRYLNKYIKLSEAIFSEDGQRQVNFLEAKYKAIQREMEIDRLKKDNELKNLMIHKRTQLNISLIFILVLCITLFAAFFRHRQRIAKKDSEIKGQKIRELEKEKILLATQSVLMGEETERQRLARDLHDGLGGLLFGVKLSLSNIKGNMIIAEENVRNFDKALTMLDTSIVELRRVAHNMMPETLIKFGLKDTMTDYCKSLSDSHAREINFQYIGKFERIDHQLEINAFRVLQEIIGNAIKHSGATELIVQIIQEPERLSLIAQDNGIGFDLQKAMAGKGIGLNSIKSRVESMKGMIDIYSEPGKGTEINVEFHLDN